MYWKNRLLVPTERSTGNPNHNTAKYCWNIYRFLVKGTLVAHLHEHRGAVTRLVGLGRATSFFASASLDGAVKIWDSAKFQGRNVANRSRHTYARCVRHSTPS